MRVTHVVRIDAGLYYGGGEIQAERTREALLLRGADVRSFQPFDKDLGDLVHFFGNFDYFNEVAEHANRLGVPYVVSPIFVSPRTVARLRWRSSRQKVLGQFPKGSAELLRGAKALFTLTDHEERSIHAYFGQDVPRFVRIPNGVEARFAQGSADAFRARFGIEGPFAIHVGTIDKSKNQLGSIAACGTDVQLAIMGRESDSEYVRACRAAAGPNVRILGSFPHTDSALADGLAAASVFILPSYRELFPLSALEATAAGCNLLLSNRWGGEEIWGGDASFADPDDSAMMASELRRLMQAPRPGNELAQSYLQRYSWDAVAAQVESEYARAVA